MLLYLKPNVVLEPLFCSWYLWSCLIPPHVSAFFLKNRYLRIMRSFLQEPEVHLVASRNSKLSGGSFLALESKHCDDIQRIVTYIEQSAGELLQLADDIQYLDELLQLEATGASLEPFYVQIPERLKGCVELIYDHNNQPGIRFFERILYEKYFKPELQSVLFSTLVNDNRQFVLSTPRIPTEQEMILPLSIDSKLLSMICRSRTEGLVYEDLMAQLNLTEEQQRQFRDFFTEEIKCRKYSKVQQGVRLRYFGHACVLIESSECSILFDPLISFMQPENGVERYTLEDLPDFIDYVVFSHNHLDHIVFETLIFLKHKVGEFVFQTSSGNTKLNPSLAIMLQHLGFLNIRSVDYLEAISLPNGLLYSYPFLGEHGDLDVQSKAGFYLCLAGQKFFFAADSNNLDNALYEYLFQREGDIPTVFIGMECVGGPLDWIYGPLLSSKVKRSDKLSRRYSGSDASKALQLAKTLNAREVYVYAMGQEPWLSHITSFNYLEESPQLIESNRFIELCKENGIYSKRLFGKEEWTYGI